MEPVSEERFLAMVDESFEKLPESIVQMLDNVIVQIEDENETEDGLLGLYEGIPLTERFDYGDMVMPDVVTLYRLPLCDFVADEEELQREVNVTLVHELAHHLGIDDDRLHELGWG